MAKSFYKFVGKRKEAFKEYQRHYPHIQPKEMANAYYLHVNDKTPFVKPYNLANFMMNDAYASYLCSRIQVISEDGKLLEGWYDQNKDCFITEGQKYQLTKERFAELCVREKIILLPEAISAVSLEVR